MDQFKKPWHSAQHYYHPPGTAPGTLVNRYCGEPQTADITMVLYNQDKVEILRPSSLDEAWKQEHTTMKSWLHISGAYQSDLLSCLGEHYGLHHLSLEDVLNEGQHPKLEEYEHGYFLTSYLLTTAEPMEVRQVNLFFGTDFVVTLVREEDQAFDMIREHFQDPESAIRGSGSDFLVYSLLDALIDRFFPCLETIRDQLGKLDDEVFRGGGPQLVEEVHSLRNRLVYLDKIGRGSQELIETLRAEDTPLISSKTRLYLRDINDHTHQFIHAIDSYREVSKGILETHLSLSGNHMNEVVKILTVFAAVFMPLTFIVGVYGMNFRPEAGPLSMPELNWAYGYLSAWGLMIMITLGMIIYFKRRHWI